MMDRLVMFELKNCPYCIKARKYLEKYLATEEFKDIDITHIDERKEAELAEQYDYYYVPTFYFGQDKLFEGAMDEKDVYNVLAEAKKRLGL